MEDDLIESAIKLIVDSKIVSASILQRRFKIGYSRAEKLIENMENRNIVSKLDEHYQRKIILQKEGF